MKRRLRLTFLVAVFFLDRDADDFTFRLSQLPPGDGSSFGSIPILNPEVAGGGNASPHDTHGSR